MESLSRASSSKQSRNRKPKTKQKKQQIRRRKAQKKETRDWLELPPEVTSMILLKLGAIEILESAQKVCSSWRKICKDPLLWRSIDMWNLGDLHDMPYDLEKMARHAIDRSCGQLVDINIEYFGTDELLKYITERSTQLRRLRLACCYSVSDEGLGEAVSKLPLLADIDLSLGSFSEEAVEAVGRHCPQLKSFKLNHQWYKLTHTESDEEENYFDVEALAIAKYMPGLRHLMLFGNQLTDDGLRAILDGCPHLVSLDLRRCFNLKLAGNLGKRCAEQIKDLQRPHDSTAGYPFIPDADDDYYDSTNDGSYYDDYVAGFSDLDLSDYDDFTQISAGSDFSDSDDYLNFY